MNKLKIYRQKSNTDCGITCLQMIASYYGQMSTVNEWELLKFSHPYALSLHELEVIASSANFQTLLTVLSFEDLVSNDLFPCIAFWQEYHYIVIEKILSSYVKIIDPFFGESQKTYDTFKAGWITKKSGSEGKGVIMYMIK